MSKSKDSSLSSGAERLKEAQAQQMKEQKKHHHKSHKKTSKTKKVVRTIVSVICSFLLAMFITVFLGSAALSFGFFNKGLTLEQINESGYYTKVYDELINNLNIIGASQNVSEDTIAKVFEEKRVYINGKQFIENSLYNKDTVVEVDKINEELQTAITKEYTKKGITVNEDVQSGIDTAISDLDTEYIRMVRFQFVSYVRQYKNAIYSVLKVLIPILIVLSLVLGFVLVKIQKYPHRGIRYLAMSFVSASAINLILPIVALVNKWYDKIDVAPDYYSQFLSNYFKSGILAFVYAGLFGLVIGIALVLLKQMLKNRIK